MKIAIRLNIGIIAIVVAGAVSNILGILALQSALDASSRINEEINKPVVLVNRITASFLQVRMNIYQLQGNDDTVQVGVLEENIGKQKDLVVSNVKDLRASLSGQIEDDTFEELLYSLEEFNFFADSAISLINAGDNDASDMKIKFELTLLGEDIGILINDITLALDESAEQIHTASLEHARFNTLVLVGILLSVTVSALVFGYFMSRSISVPLGETATLSEEIAEGNLVPNMKLKALKRRDETGALARAMEKMLITLRESIGAIASAEEEARTASAELDKRLNNEVTEVREIGKTVSMIEQLSSRQNNGVDEANSALELIIQSLKDLNELIDTQAANVTQSSTSIEEMIGNITSVSSNVNNMNTAFQSLETASQKGQERMDITQEVIKRVAAQSGQLHDANSVINSIASQTNLLAMNAAIEAAHAGDSGRGFAVVADEIRKLAEMASIQSKEISSDISEISNSIEDLGSASRDTGDAFDEIQEQVKILGNYEQEIKQAMDEQLIGSRQIMEATAQLNDITSQVQDSSLSMMDANMSIVGQMAALKESSEELNERVGLIEKGTFSISSSIEDIQKVSQRSAKLALDLRSQIERFNIDEFAVSKFDEIRTEG